MSKRAAVLAAFLLACGGRDSTPPAGASPDGGGPERPTGTVPLALTAGVGTVKIAVNAATVVLTPVTTYDATTDTNVPVTCTTDANCGGGATCITGVCTQSSTVNQLLYVKNQSGANLNAPVQLPCSGTDYTIEVYSANETAAPFTLQDVKVSVPLTVSSTCAVTPTPTASSWTDRANPTFAFPAIYVGLPSPYDKYTVRFQNVAYPWSTSTWSFVQGANNPTSVGGASATFAAPSAAGTLSFTGKFYLASPLLVTGETSTSWGRTLNTTAQAMASSGVPLP